MLLVELCFRDILLLFPDISDIRKQNMDLFKLHMLSHCSVQLESDLNIWSLLTLVESQVADFDLDFEYEFFTHLRNTTGMLFALKIVNMMRGLLDKSTEIAEQVKHEGVLNYIHYLLDEAQPNRVVQFYHLIKIFGSV